MAAGLSKGDFVRIFIFLHIATVMTAVAFSIGPTFLLRRIADSGDVPAIRRSFALAAPLVRLIPALFGVGALLGIIAIFTNGFNPFEPWLLIAYVLFVLAAAVGARLTTPWFKRMMTASAESPDTGPSGELTAAVNDQAMALVEWFDVVVVLVFILDMVFKPFS